MPYYRDYLCYNWTKWQICWILPFRTFCKILGVSPNMFSDKESEKKTLTGKTGLIFQANDVQYLRHNTNTRCKSGKGITSGMVSAFTRSSKDSFYVCIVSTQALIVKYRKRDKEHGGTVLYNEPIAQVNRLMADTVRLIQYMSVCCPNLSRMHSPTDISYPLAANFWHN